MNYITRPMRRISTGKLQGQLWKLTASGLSSLMKQRLHAISSKKNIITINTYSTKPASARELACMYDRMDDICVVAKNKDGNYTGWACLWGFNSNPGPRIMIYVAAQYRKKGIGSTLLSRSVSYFKRKGYRSVYAEPWSVQSVHFFKKHGFKDVAGLDFFSAKLII